MNKHKKYYYTLGLFIVTDKVPRCCAFILYTYGGWSLGWSGGRRLSTMSGNGQSLSFAYDGDGQRTEKTVNGSTHKYLYRGGLLIADICGNDALYFRYDQNGEVIGFLRTLGTNRAEYRYVKNQQGDIVAVIDFAGAEAATYSYDGWGNVLTTGGYDADLASRNPLRYRGYYYDSETELYYVTSRYYDPEIGRWINADIPETIIADFEKFAQYNLFAYCFNNPVNLPDETGTWPGWATKLAIGVGAIVVGAAVVAATAATGGAAAAFVGAAVTGLKAAAVSGAIGAAVGVGTSAVSYRVSTGSWNGAGKAAIDGAVDGFASGFMTGGIMAGGSQILSSGFKVAANAGVPTGRNGGLTIGNKVRVLSPNHPQAYEAGGTLLKIGSKYWKQI